MDLEDGAYPKWFQQTWKFIFKRKILPVKKLMDNELPQLILDSVHQGVVCLKISEAGIYQGQSSEVVIRAVHFGLPKIHVKTQTVRRKTFPL